MTYIKFLRPGRIGTYSGWQWPEVGTWTDLISSTELEVCVHGYHVADGYEHALHWIAAEAYEVELSGTIIASDNKVVASRAKLVRKLNWNAAVAAEFAKRCADHVSHLRDAAATADAAYADAHAAAVRAAAAAYAAADDADAYARERVWQANLLKELLTREG